FLFTVARSPISTLFPYTTLFRSAFRRRASAVCGRRPRTGVARIGRGRATCDGDAVAGERAGIPAGLRRFRTDFRALAQRHRRLRSEEHTSELQSRFDLVCRLLLE